MENAPVPAGKNERFTMDEDTKKIIGRMALRLFALFPESYLVSEHFSRFFREQDLDDAWKESLERSRDRPDLYGDAVIKNAFELFLQHMVHSRPDEFPALLSRVLTGFSHGIYPPLPLDDLKKDLMDLGYPAEDLKEKFSVLHASEEEQLKRRTTVCPD
jgi:hypothetical protein